MPCDQGFLTYCGQCGQIVTAARRTKRFCSSACRKAKWRTTKAARDRILAVAGAGITSNLTDHDLAVIMRLEGSSK